jgi:DNA-binding CsgD family transcriptional regulator
MPLGKPLLEALDRMSCGGIVLDSSGEVLRVNPSAERILKGLQPDAPCKALSREQVCAAIKRLLTSSRRFTLKGKTWTSVERNAKRQLLMHSIRLDERSASGPDCVVIMVDLDSSPALNPATLQGVFGFTAAEASLATEIATGKSLAEIAQARGVSIATARTQLAAIFAKTYTRRQAELVALLTRISILP